MMEPNDMFKQMTDFQKTAFDNSISTMSMIQTRTEKMLEMFVNQIVWASEKWKDVVTDWNKAYQEVFGNFKKVMDDNFTKIESYIR